MATVVDDSRTADLQEPWHTIREEWRRRDFVALRNAVSELKGFAPERVEGIPERVDDPPEDLLERVDGLLFPPPPKKDVPERREVWWRAFAKNISEPLHGVLRRADRLFRREPPREHTNEPGPEDEAHKAFAAAVSVLTEAFEAVDPESRPLLALYVYGQCLKKWETSEAYGQIERVLAALHEVTKPQDTSTESQFLGIIAEQAQHLKHAMGVEQAMNCSCPVAVAECAGLVVGSLDKLLPKEQRLGEEVGFDGLLHVVRSDAQTSRQYFAATQEIAGAVHRLVDPDAPDLVDEGKTQDSPDPDSALEGDVYESELRPHRKSLEALEAAAASPRLQIDAAEVVYLYPFTLEGPDGEEVDATAEALGDEVARRLRREGFQGATAHELERNDLWDRPDVREPGYSGWRIELPPITLETTAKKALDFTAEVRLSRMGNHLVRVSTDWSPDKPANLNEVNQALRRGSPGMGAETLSWEGQQAKCEKLADFATAVINEIAKAVVVGQKPTESVINPGAQFHVVLAARSISVLQQDGNRSDVTPTLLGVTDGGQQLEKPEPAVGASLLFHPIRHLATSLEEWIRYPPPTVTNLLEGQGYAGDLVVRTDNTTVTFMPASPEWFVDEYKEMIEFVASIPPLLTLWENQAGNLTDRLNDMLPRIAEQVERGDDPIAQLQKLEMAIRELESDIRGELARLGSAAFCRTRAHRDFLNVLWTAAGLPALTSELERRLTLLADRQERIATLVSSIDQRIRRKLERPVTFVLGLLAVASLAEVLSWINQAHDIRGGSVTWVVEVVALVVAALVVLVVLWRTRRSR